MKTIDLLRMSFSSLMKRKLRTVLTVLGVIIGIASIVIMVSLGLGLRQQQMDMIEEYGGLKTINVREGNGGQSYSSQDSSNLDKKLDDSTVDLIGSLDYVEMASPILEFSAIAKTGGYTLNIYNGYGYKLDALNSMDWQFAEGEMPKEGDPLKFIYGNLILENFTDARDNYIYYDTGVLPDVDLMKAPMFTIFDTDAYYASQGSSGEISFGDADGGEQAAPKTPPKKYLIETAGVLYGTGPDDYRNYSNNVYCDLDALIPHLKKVFKGKAIPGQPTKKNGSPYKTIYYSEIMVRVDKVDNVKEVQKTIQDMGYEANSNNEWIEETKKTSQQQQAMLGGIGAVALLVAAIGIANTMMMSIYERTKEIGIMKVLGCDMGDIRSLFLIEAALIGFIGGVVGDILSFAVSMIINAVTGSKTSLIPIWLYAVGLGFAVFVGVAAGFFPSKRAMELSPLSAIRNE